MEGKKVLIVSTFVLVFVSFVFAGQAEAASASLYLSPSTGSYTVGNTFLVQVKLNSGGVSINASDGTLVFNPDSLEVARITKTDPIFSLWVQEPTFSNSVGTINFAGGVPSPGFVGSSGLIINITFKAKTAGTASLTFAAGSILADDGKGTNILTSLGAGSYTLSGKMITPLPPSVPSTPSVPSISGAPGLPVVSSPTHPDEDEWYSNNDPEFTWDLPSGVTGVSLLMHEKPIANPGPNSDGLLGLKEYQDVEDGTWYFHIKFKNQYGWGSILHRKVLIDTVSPEPFEVTVDNDGDLTNPTPTLHFSTTDSLSGIEYYEVEMADEIFTITEQERRKSPFRLPPQAPGKVMLEVRAYDKAGNFSRATTELEISPIDVFVKILEIPSRIDVGEPLVIKGVSDPETTVRIYLQRENKDLTTDTVETDSVGKFVFTYEKALPQGNYQVWARAEDKRGALSNPTPKYLLDVGLPPFLRFGKVALDYLTAMITLIVLIVGAIAIIFYTWYRISVWKKDVRQETEEVSQSVVVAFRALRDEVEEQIAMLDKKPGLTKGEKEIRDKLQEALDVSEKFIDKEIKDVKKRLE